MVGAVRSPTPGGCGSAPGGLHRALIRDGVDSGAAAQGAVTQQCVIHMAAGHSRPPRCAAETFCISRTKGSNLPVMVTVHAGSALRHEAVTGLVPGRSGDLVQA